jgi:hypothetical protein
MYGQTVSFHREPDYRVGGFLDGFAQVCKPVDARYLWRPNLKDEADNHLVELAIAANANTLLLITCQTLQLRNLSTWVTRSLHQYKF